TMMRGVDETCSCTVISITDSSETAGLGAVASQSSEKGEAFRAQFVGVSGTVSVSKEGGEIDALSGATITSRAICTGVTAALEYCANLG
ncbi:MAG: FMN-binding protein, partial [Clostridiales bacterium]|nr:FMN-binding protein [Clostridiales bacterium]